MHFAASPRAKIRAMHSAANATRLSTRSPPAQRSALRANAAARNCTRCAPICGTNRLRGNVDTRLRKLARRRIRRDRARDGGLEPARVQRDPYRRVCGRKLVPAVGQGALAIGDSRRRRRAFLAILRGRERRTVAVCVAAERAVLRAFVPGAARRLASMRRLSAR